MDNAILGMKTLNISQGYYSDFTHKNLYQIDLCGEDSGVDTWSAKMHLKCLKILRYKETGFANTVFFGTCDAKGNMAKVHTPELGDVVLTLAMTHDNIIGNHIQEGKVYSGDDKIYEEGTTGNASGNHIHLEIAKGWQKSKIKYLGSKYYNGVQYAMKNLVPIEKALFLLDEYTNIKNDNNYDFKWTNNVESSDNVKLIEGYQRLKWNGSTVHAYKIKCNQKLGLMSAGDWNVVKPIDKIDDNHIHYCKVNANRFVMANGAHLGVEQSFTLDNAPKQNAFIALYKDKSGYNYCDADKYWLSKKDVEFGCSPDVIMIFNNNAINKIATSVSPDRMTIITNQTLLMVLDDDSEVLVVAENISLNSLVNFARAYNSKHCFAFDGGGSSQMIVNGEKKLYSGRAISNVLTIYKDSTEQSDQVEPNIKCSNCETLKQKNDLLMVENNNLREENMMLNNKLNRIKDIVEER